MNYKCFDVKSVVGGCRDLENAARKFCSERVRVDMSAGEVRPPFWGSYMKRQKVSGNEVYCTE